MGVGSRGTLQVRPCKLHHRIHAMEGPGYPPTRPRQFSGSHREADALPHASDVFGNAPAPTSVTVWLLVVVVGCGCWLYPWPPAHCLGRGCVGSRDRRTPWMAYASLQGCTCSVSREPTHPRPPKPHPAPAASRFPLQDFGKPQAPRANPARSCRVSPHTPHPRPAKAHPAPRASCVPLWDFGETHAPQALHVPQVTPSYGCNKNIIS